MTIEGYNIPASKAPAVDALIDDDESNFASIGNTDEIILQYENAGSRVQAQMMQPQVNPLPWLCQAFQAVFGIASEVSARICNVCPFYARNHVLFICRIAEKAMFRKLLHNFHPFHSLNQDDTFHISRYVLTVYV